MAVIDRIRRKKKEEALVEKLAESYHEIKEKGEDNPVDATVDKVMEIIKKSKNPEKTAEKMLKAALENATAEPEKAVLSTKIPTKVAIQISEMEGISDSVIPNAVQNSNTDVPDKVINEIIKEGSIGEDERLQLIKNVDDEKIIHDRIKNEFLILYKNCKDKRDHEVVASVKEIQDVLEKSKCKLDVQEYITQIIAKKMAENFYSDIKKGTRIYTLAQLMTPEKMLENDLSKKTEIEYEKIEKEQGEKEGRFSEVDLKKQILGEIAKGVGYRYKKSKAFIIPQSEAMKKITLEEENIFIAKVQIASGKKLTEDEIMEIRDQIQGIIRNKKTKEFMLIDRIKNIQDEEIDLISNITKDKTTLETIKMLEKKGLINELNLIPTDKKEIAIESISKTLSRRRKENSKKIEEPTFPRDEGDR